jgi:hypothetical protein
VADTNNDDKNRPLTEEQEKMYFEYFKQLTTLNVATALVLLNRFLTITQRVLTCVQIR